jgi:cysteine desulfurase
MDVIYLDNNATTQTAPEVVEAMLPFFTEWYGNPSSVHRFGQLARKAVDDARASVGNLIGAAENEITFTASGTEGVNTAVRGLLATRTPRKRIVTSTVEHAATRQLCGQLQKEGFEVVDIAVDSQGMLDMPGLVKAVSDEVALVSMLWANNETGVIFPVDQIASLCRSFRVPFHTDGTQVIGKIPVNVGQLEIDAMSFAAHKFHGPKGIGGLFIRRGQRIRPLLIGGTQERGRRGGTENVPGIVGMGKAAELAVECLPKNAEIARQRDRFENSILKNISETYVNGSVEHRVPNTSNISFAQLEAEAILLLLSEQGICASAGAACSSGSLEPSPVLKAMNLDPKISHGAIRFSLSRYTTDREIDQTLRVLPGIIERLRKVLPVEA